MDWSQSVARRALEIAGCLSFFIAGGATLGAQQAPASSQPLANTGNFQQNSPNATLSSACEPARAGSPYVNVDSWVYPAVLRLYSIGYLDHVFLGMRPWTRNNLIQLLNDVSDRIEDAGPGPLTDQATQLHDALARELQGDMTAPCGQADGHLRLESAYTIMRGLSGTPLHDSFHLGSTIINDYDRPYQHGFNNDTGLSGYLTAGRFTVYARGELQHAPSATGYSTALAMNLSNNIDLIPFLDPLTGLPLNQATIPMGPIDSITRVRWLEAYASAHVLGHEVSFGKQDNWLGPGLGAGMAYSNNAENIYSFRINRVDPVRVPGLSLLTGPFRYDFLVGSLKGHTYPNAPWVHVEKVSFKPTDNLEFGFERTVIWGGKGHVPITLHTFLRSFFSLTAPQPNVKNSSADPGARFGSFDFTYRLPGLRNWLTLYSDAKVHDDVSPIDAPRRASWRPGLYLSHVPGLPQLDLRFETAWTDPPITNSYGGRFMDYETVQRQGYTNNGQLFGDWIGREDKGGQAWITYHLSGNEWIQVSARNQKAAKDFIASPTAQYGTTLNDLKFQAVKRIGTDLEINGSFTLEHYKAPIYLPGQQTVTTTDIRLTWYPGRKVDF